MDLLDTLLIAFGLAMDCFAVSLGIGTLQSSHHARPILRISFHFGLFQGGMTLLGWLAGSTIATFISGFDHWIAFGLLVFIGIRMILEGLEKKTDINQNNDPSRGMNLVMLSVATSIDALAVGLSLAFLKVNIVTSSLTIGLVSLGLSLIGLLIGNTLGIRFGKRVEILGGLILISIGLRIVISHLLGG